MRRIFPGLVIFAIALSLSACGTANNDDGSSASSTSFRRPDFGQPDRKAEISGLVKSIMGNEVTILKIERPADGQGDQKNTDNQGQEQGNGQNRTGLGGSRFMGPGGGAPGENGNNSVEAKALRMEALKKMSTGEETVLIPVGIRMLKPDTASMETAKQPQMLEASLTDVQADKMVQIWLDQTIADRKVAEFVFIR